MRLVFRIGFSIYLISLARCTSILGIRWPYIGHSYRPIGWLTSPKNARSLPDESCFPFMFTWFPSEWWDGGKFHCSIKAYHAPRKGRLLYVFHFFSLAVCHSRLRILKVSYKHMTPARCVHNGNAGARFTRGLRRVWRRRGPRSVFWAARSRF